MTAAEDQPSPASRGDLEAVIGHAFQDPGLYQAAMTHPSFAHENPDLGPDNQRMEFLGDAVLGLAMARTLFERNPDLPEGRLSRIKAALVCEDTLAQLADELELPRHLRLGRGEMASGGYAKNSILADSVEALIAAVYLDGGYKTAESMVRRLFEERLGDAEQGQLVFDSKTVLQELVQSRGMERPIYRVEGQSGPPHKRSFIVSASLQGEVVAEGQGRSKKEAEKRAAAAALKTLRKRPQAAQPPAPDTGTEGDSA